MQKYGTIQPPDYNLANVKLPVYLHYSANDMYVNVQVRMLFIAMLQSQLNFSSFSSLFIIFTGLASIVQGTTQCSEIFSSIRQLWAYWFLMGQACRCLGIQWNFKSYGKSQKMNIIGLWSANYVNKNMIDHKFGFLVLIN